MQTTITAEYHGKTVAGWLHRSGSKTLVILIHSHNSDGTRGRFITLAKELERLGIDCLRFSITRNELAANVAEVTSVTEEVAQTKAILSMIRSKYSRVIAAGHSQGGIVALQLGLDGLVDAVVQLMANATSQFHIDSKLERLGVSLSQARTQAFVPYLGNNGKYYGYTAAYFDDFVRWHTAEMLEKNKKPILFVEADDDEMLERGEVRKNYALANGAKELFTVHSKHNFSEDNAILIARKMVLWMHEHKLA